MTADAGDLDDWTAPAQERIDEHLRGCPTTVRVGDVVRECVVLREDDRLALQCPLVPALPGDLAAARRAWLDRLVAATGSCWRIVRLNGDGSSIVAVVDLSGAPPGAVAGLLRVGLMGVSSKCPSW